MANIFSPKTGRGSGAKKHAIRQMKKARLAQRRSKRPHKWNDESWKRNTPATHYWVLGGNGLSSGKNKDGSTIVAGPARNPGWYYGS